MAHELLTAAAAQLRQESVCLTYCEMLGEREAGLHFYNVYCTPGNTNWYYSVAWNKCQQPGIYPTGNAIERYNECIKGTSQVEGLVEQRVDREAFFNQSLPSIARDVYYEQVVSLSQNPQTFLSAQSISLWHSFG
jgi:hypothetical protein